VTFPERESDLPTSGRPERYPGVGENAEYSEGVFVGYRHFDQAGIAPRFPFGHGLSYASWEYSGLRVRSVPNGRLAATVSLDVRNTSGRTGSDVAQLYVGMPAPSESVPQPPRALKRFEKVQLGPGARRRVNFLLDERALSYWDEPSKSWKVAPGCYTIEVARSSRDPQLVGGLQVGDPPGGCRPGAVKLPSGSVCAESPPRSSIASGGGLRAARTRVSLRGRTVDLACRRGKERGRVSRVEVGFAQRVGKRCRWLGRSGRLGKARSCARPAYRAAKLGRVRAGKVPWTFRARARLPRGRYLALVRGRDDGGAVEKRRGRFNKRSFTVR
jgi:hypothetical protein